MITLYNQNNKATNVLGAILKFKGTPDVRSEPAKADLPDAAIKIDSIIIHGLETIFRFIEERYPHPELYSSSPVERALIQMLVNDIVTNAYHNDADAERILAELLPQVQTHPFILGKKITLPDIALLEILPMNPDWDDYRARVLGALGQ